MAKSNSRSNGSDLVKGILCVAAFSVAAMLVMWVMTYNSALPDDLYFDAMTGETAFNLIIPALTGWIPQIAVFVMWLAMISPSLRRGKPNYMTAPISIIAFFVNFVAIFAIVFLSLSNLESPDYTNLQKALFLLPAALAATATQTVGMLVTSLVCQPAKAVF